MVSYFINQRFVDIMHTIKNMTMLQKINNRNFFLLNWQKFCAKARKTFFLFYNVIKCTKSRYFSKRQNALRNRHVCVFQTKFRYKSCIDFEGWAVLKLIIAILNTLCEILIKIPLSQRSIFVNIDKFAIHFYTLWLLQFQKWVQL